MPLHCFLQAAQGLLHVGTESAGAGVPTIPFNDKQRQIHSTNEEKDSVQSRLPRHVAVEW